MLINFMVVGESGPMFLKIMNCEGDVKDRYFIWGEIIFVKETNFISRRWNKTSLKSLKIIGCTLKKVGVMWKCNGNQSKQSNLCRLQKVVGV